MPGLHITLGIFLRLFTLMEDECHKLDLEMAALASAAPSDCDRPSFVSFTSMVQRERELLNTKQTLKVKIKLLDQTLSFLLLTSPSSSLPVKAVEQMITQKKENLTAIVRK